MPQMDRNGQLQSSDDENVITIHDHQLHQHCLNKMTRDNCIVSSSQWNRGTHPMVDFNENLKKMVNFTGFLIRLNIQIFIRM